MSSPLPAEVDVLIVGAGPAGIMCATALGKAGVSVRIVDKRPVKVAAGQADGLSPRTLEVLQSYGIAERVLRDGCPIYMAAFYDPGPDGGIQLSRRTVDVLAPNARYPFELALHQGGIESIFLETMSSMGIEVERSTIPTNIEITEDEDELTDPNSYSVKVTLQRLEQPEGQNEEVVSAKFVLGADGAHSWVRKTMGITMDGQHTDYIWGVLDIVPGPESDFPDIRSKCLIHSNNGSCLILPREGDLNRMYIQLSDKDLVDPDTGRIDKDRVGPKELLETFQKSVKPFTIVQKGDVEWWTIYIVGQRVASKFSVHNRVFIAGDACHTHSPKAGQGMNASMNDVHNLAWKLAFVLRGWADMSILTTYEFERRKFAQDLINFDNLWAGMVCEKPSHEEFYKVYRAFGGFTSNIGVHYEPSPVIREAHQSLASNLVIGERVAPQIFLRAADAAPWELQDLLPSNFRYKLLLFIGDYDGNASQRQRVDAMVKDLEQPENFLKRYASKDASNPRFDLLTITKGKKEEFVYLSVPLLLRQHWSKVLIDDVDIQGNIGGKGYSYFGVADEGAIVVVRPDGFVGTIAPLDGVAGLNDYFAQFMI